MTRSILKEAFKNWLELLGFIDIEMDYNDGIDIYDNHTLDMLSRILLEVSPWGPQSERLDKEMIKDSK